MNVSVVLTTYNGKKYIEVLLDSLKQQTKEIDELLIYDDGSTDGTPEFIRQYILANNLSWKVHINEINKGWKQNFRDGILQANGDLVFPCDQDDIWEINKIERMVKIMEEVPTILLLSTDYSPIYEIGGQTVGHFKGENGKLEKVIFNSHFASAHRPGCVMAIRRELIERARKIWENWYPHDAFLWTLAVFFGGCYILHEPLICYRRHLGNATNRMTRNRREVILSLKRNYILAEWMLNTQVEAIDVSRLKIIGKYKVYAKLRLELLENRKITNFFRLFIYAEFYKSLKQEFGDLYLLFQRE